MKQVEDFKNQLQELDRSIREEIINLLYERGTSYIHEGRKHLEISFMENGFCKGPIIYPINEPSKPIQISRIWLPWSEERDLAVLFDTVDKYMFDILPYTLNKYYSKDTLITITILKHIMAQTM